jgi:tetratricopeptide (TPR) repeat protein
MANSDETSRPLTPQARRNLDLEIGFLEGVRRRDPHYVEVLQALGDSYTRRGRLQEGLEVDESLVRLRPENPLAHFNLACSYSLTGQLPRAAEALHRAIDLGYRDFNWMRRDPDLAALRKDPAYKSIRERVRKLKIQID